MNCSKSCEVIFSDSRRRGRSVPEPAPLPGITRSRCLKVLGVNIASDFSVSQHIQRLETASAQTVYALRLLRSRGLVCDTALQHVYRSITVIARLMYSASTSRGLASTSDRQRRPIDSVIDRLHSLLLPPSSASQRYNLRNRTHLLQLPYLIIPHTCQTKTSSLTSCLVCVFIQHVTHMLENAY